MKPQANYLDECARRKLFLGLCALALLHTGANISQSYVNYPGWYVFDAASFKAYHLPMSIRAAVFLMAPRVIELALALIVLRFRPIAVERWVLIVGCALTAGGILSTLLISRPIHAQLDIQGNTPELVSRLMATDWIRNIMEWFRAGLYIWVLSRLVNQQLMGKPQEAGRR